jgi:hypothetical protein
LLDIKASVNGATSESEMVVPIAKSIATNGEVEPGEKAIATKSLPKIEPNSGRASQHS